MKLNGYSGTWLAFVITALYVASHFSPPGKKSFSQKARKEKMCLEKKEKTALNFRVTGIISSPDN